MHAFVNTHPGRYPCVPPFPPYPPFPPQPWETWEPWTPWDHEWPHAPLVC